jgi:hypothetical protein
LKSIDSLLQRRIIQFLVQAQGLRHLIALAAGWIKTIGNFSLGRLHRQDYLSVTMTNQSPYFTAFTISNTI